MENEAQASFANAGMKYVKSILKKGPGFGRFSREIA
jgi:hypothetical protein